MPPADSPRRGRPRDATVRQRVLAAAVEIAAEDPALATFDRIAAAAGVSRTTLYRWWPGPRDLVLEALMESTRWSLAHDDGNARARITAQVADLVTIMTHEPTARMVRFLAGGSVVDQGARDRFAAHWLAPRHDAAAAILTAAIEAGQVRADTPVDVTIDLLFAPVYRRALLTSAPLDAGYADAVVDVIWRAIESPQHLEPGHSAEG